MRSLAAAPLTGMSPIYLAPLAICKTRKLNLGINVGLELASRNCAQVRDSTHLDLGNLIVAGLPQMLDGLPPQNPLYPP